MPSQEFNNLLREVRISSRWPEIPDFANRVGISFGGYRKYESGERLPSWEALNRIITNGLIEEATAAELRNLWTQAKAYQAGLEGSVVEKKSVDADKLAAHIQSEVVYVLKQDGIHPLERTKKVLLNRIQLLLRSRLED
jgi:transcriptional regulator with XRE-family HTH domain